MSNRADSGRPADEESVPFADAGATPLARQRAVRQFLTQETRYAIMMAVLGHPDHALSLDELDYLVPKNRSTIVEHLEKFDAHGILTQYRYDGERRDANDPRLFWGPTAAGVRLLDEYDYLRYLPVVQALFGSVFLTQHIERHRAAHRPPLPAVVTDTLTIDPLDEGDAERVEQAVAAEQSAPTRLFDAPPIEPDPDAETAAGADRPLDELF